MSTSLIAHHASLVAGHRVPFQVAGAGEPVVLVHGLAGSVRWWAQTVPILAEHFRVYLVDLPGFGELRGQRFVLAEAADWLRRWMESVGLRRASLVGHSMGAYVCIQGAARWPDAVDRLVLVDAAGVPVGRSALGHAVPLLQEARGMTWRRLCLLVSDALRAGPGCTWRAAREIVAADVRRELALIRAPTLIVWGEDDRLVPLAAAHVLRREIPDSRLLVLKGAGHNPMLDRPRAFDTAVAAFLAGEPVGD